MIEAWVISFALILIRVGTFWAAVPIWTALKPPRLVKLGLVIALSIFWLLYLPKPVSVANQWSAGELHWFFLIVAGLGELLTGGLLAMAFKMFFVPLKIAGSYIGQELGLTMATLSDSNSGEVNNIFATLLFTFAVVAFFVLDLHHYLFYCLHASFDLLPPGELPNWKAVATLIDGFSKLTENGILMCAPIAIVSFLSLITLLVLARTAPSLNLFSIGIPVRLLVGLMAILFLLPFLMTSATASFESSIEFLKSLLQSLVTAA